MKLHFFIFIFVSLLGVCWSGVSVGSDYATRPEVQAYINELVAVHQFDRARLLRLFREVKKQHRVLQIIEKPAEGKPWYLYRKIFVNPRNINKGVSFWFKHQSLLQQVEKAYQIPTEIILAIIGIETVYGENPGSFPLVDTLVTLSFDYPRRSAFFRKELTNMFLLVREEKYTDYQGFKSSYAGAMGIGQFIPSSYREYAVDFDGDGQRDLWGSLPDVVASVANFLVRHGWQANQSVGNVIVLANNQATLANQANRQFEPYLEVANAIELGVVDAKSSIEGLFSLYSFEIDEGRYQYWAGYQNFYTITRYNHSRRYALAVYQLAQAIKEKYQVRVRKG